MFGKTSPLSADGPNIISAIIHSPAVVIVLASVHLGLLLVQSVGNSPVIDEVGHLPAGISVWKLGRFDLYRVNPPLVKCVAAIPAVVGGANNDWSSYYELEFERPEWGVGQSFIKANGDRWFRWFVYARCAVIPLSLLGGLICYSWARELYGHMGGVLSLTLWCFSPNILAWGATITPDVGATALGLLAAWLFWRWLSKPEWQSAALAGLALGFAQLAKMTWVILFLLWPILWAFWVSAKPEKSVQAECSEFGRSNRLGSRELGQLMLLLVVGLYVLNAGYAFDGSFGRLGDYTFGTRLLAGTESLVDGKAGGNRFRNTAFECLRVPIPREYLRGMDLQWVDFERKKMSYLNGEWKKGGWWYYYLVVIAIKVPLGTWIVLGWVVLGFFCTPGWRRHWRDEFILLAPAVTVFVMVSSQTGFSRYLRYILPCFPFAFVWCGKLGLTFQHRQRLASVLIAAALIWSISSSIWVFPHSMSYFNELAGGPKGGYRYLLDANVDWGQDLFYFKDWYVEHPEARPIRMVFHSPIDNDHFGLSETHNAENSMQWYAISVHRLFENDSRYEFLWKHHSPVDMVGYSIWIFRVDGPEHAANLGEITESSDLRPNTIRQNQSKPSPGFEIPEIPKKSLKSN